MSFDSLVSINVVVSQLPIGNHKESDDLKSKNYQVPLQASNGLLHTPPAQVQFQNADSGRAPCRDRSYGNTEPRCHLCEKFGYLVNKCFH